MQNFITPFLSSSGPPPYFHVPRPTSGILRPVRPNSRSFIYATPALPGWFVRKADAQLLPLGEGAVRVARFCAWLYFVNWHLEMSGLLRCCGNKPPFCVMRSSRLRFGNVL